MALCEYLGRQVLGVLAAYQSNGVVHHVGAVYPRSNNELRVFLPKGHTLQAGAKVTLHLDNRTGVEEFDAELPVYRASYKGRVTGIDEYWIFVEPIEYVLMYGGGPIEEYHEQGYRFPHDERGEKALPVTPMKHLEHVSEAEHDNKIGILTTLAMNQPHTTVLAFLNTSDDDVFLISIPDTFKIHQLRRNPHCFFIIDERAKFTFEHAIDWNYTILEMQTYRVPPEMPLYEQVRTEFLIKSPFEADFFLMDGAELLHLKKKSFVFAGEACRVDEPH